MAREGYLRIEEYERGDKKCQIEKDAEKIEECWIMYHAMIRKGDGKELAVIKRIRKDTKDIEPLRSMAKQRDRVAIQETGMGMGVIGGVVPIIKEAIAMGPNDVNGMRDVEILDDKETTRKQIGNPMAGKLLSISEK